MIARLHRRHALTDRVYDTRTLMAADDWVHGRTTRDHLENFWCVTECTGSKMFIRMAQSRERNLYSDFVGVRLIDLDGLGVPRTIEFTNY